MLDAATLYIWTGDGCPLCKPQMKAAVLRGRAWARARGVGCVAVQSGSTLSGALAAKWAADGRGETLPEPLFFFESKWATNLSEF